MNELFRKWCLASSGDRKRAIRRLCLVEAARRLKKNSKDDHVKNLKALTKSLDTAISTIYPYLAAADCALEQKPRYSTLAQLLVLIPEYGNNRGVSHSFDAEAVDWAISQYCKTPGIGFAKVYGLLKVEGQRNGWKIGSIDSLRRIFGFG